jgi:GAF domain-containing protein
MDAVSRTPSPIDRLRELLPRFGAAAFILVCAALALTSWSDLGVRLDTDPAHRWPALVGLGGLIAGLALHAWHTRRQLLGLEEKLRDSIAREAGSQARFAELSFLFDVSTQLQLRLDLPTMLDLAAQRLLACLDATQSSIMLYDDQQGVLEVKAAAGVDLPLVRGARVAPGEGIAGLVYISGESLLLTPRVIQERFAEHVKRARNIGSGLCVPMRFRDQPIGVIGVTRKSGSWFDASHVKMLESFADHCAATVVKTHHHHEMLRHVQLAA